MDKRFTLLFTIAVLSVGQMFASGTDKQIKTKADENKVVYADSAYEILESKTHNEAIHFTGFSTLIVGSGETLTINGDLELDERSKVFVEEGATILVYGNLKLEGDTEIRLEGKVHVLGALQSKHKASVYGKGMLRVIGQSSISNESLIFGESLNYIDSKVFTEQKGGGLAQSLTE